MIIKAFSLTITFTDYSESSVEAIVHSVALHSTILN